jgi:hypothetical protein
MQDRNVTQVESLTIRRREAGACITCHRKVNRRDKHRLPFHKCRVWRTNLPGSVTQVKT